MVDSHRELFSATGAVAVTPHDTNTIGETRGLIVTVAGTVRATFQDGSDVVFQCAAGVVIPVCVNLIHTDSTATGIVALY